MYQVKNNAMDDLLVKYLLHETTAEEFAEAEQWINASSDHRQYFEHLRQIWRSGDHLKVVDGPDEEEAWQRLRQRIHHNNIRQAPAYIRSIRRRRMFSIAAALLLVLTGSWIRYHQMHTAPVKLLTISSGENIRTDTLTDGTIISLNKNSHLSYPVKFSGKARIVELQGEAFFDVAEQKDHPFIVHVNKVTVTVLGTSFNIRSTNDATEIIVETGRVQVTRQHQSIQLTSHEKVSVSKAEQSLRKVKVAGELYNYYRTKAFICNKTPLGELVSALNEVYQAHIVIANPALKDLPITTTFKGASLDTILTIITQTFDQITFTRQGQQIILK